MCYEQNTKNIKMQPKCQNSSKRCGVFERNPKLWCEGFVYILGFCSVFRVLFLTDLEKAALVVTNGVDTDDVSKL